MDYRQNQGQGAQNALATPKPITVSERLSRTAELAYKQCTRIERVLSRINGTPQAEQAGMGDSIAKIAVTPPLVNSVEQLEGQIERLGRLTDGLENIA